MVEASETRINVRCPAAWRLLGAISHALRLGRLLPFLAAGLPGFAVSLALNFLLVTRLNCRPAYVYPFVLFVQLLVNYTICRSAVFPEDARHHRFVPHFLHYLSGTLLIRAADWALYSSMVEAGLYFAVAQSLNVVIFSLIRYSYAKLVFQRGHFWRIGVKAQTPVSGSSDVELPGTVR